MTTSLPRWVHRNLPRAAPPDCWQSLRSARVPPVHYLDKPLRLSLGATSHNPGVQFSMSKRVQFRMSVDSRWTGACYPGAASDDGNPHIFIHPVLSDSTRVAGVVVHQLCHVALGNRSHGPPFRRLATAMGLVGKMTKTIEGPLFLAIMPATIDRIGPYPHSALRQLRRLDRKLARTRLVRVHCAACGYLVRTTQRWLMVAVPICPNPDCPSLGEPMAVG